MFATFIGDVHGCCLTLEALLQKIPHSNNQIVLLGDLINKGKRSYETYTFVKKMGYQSVMGNHEFYCINRNYREWQAAWQKQGGKETIASVKRNTRAREGKELQVIFAEMSYYFSGFRPYLAFPTAYGQRILATHAGIGERLFHECGQSLANCLKKGVGHKDSHIFNKSPLAQIPGCIQVVGHQPTALAPVRAGNNYYVDSGCVYERNGMGYLSALMVNLETEGPPRVFQQENID